jgi:hypothetical protein
MLECFQGEIATQVLSVTPTHAAILTLGLELSPLSLHHQNANVPAQEYNK